MRHIIQENVVDARQSCIDARMSCYYYDGMSIHRRIKERRIEMGLESHSALAVLCGVSWQTVQLWEKEGGTAPNRNRIDKVASILNVSVEWLTTGREPQKLYAVPNTALSEKNKNDVESDDLIELFALFQRATPRERENILDLARSISNRKSLRWKRVD